MTEDVSLIIRLAVTIVLLSAIVSTVLVISQISFAYYGGWVSMQEEGLRPTSVLVFDEVSAQSSVTAAELYKLHSLNEEYIWSTKITYLNGVTSSSYKELKTAGTKRFKVKITYNSDGNHPGQYNVVAQEVSQ